MTPCFQSDGNARGIASTAGVQNLEVWDDAE